MCLYIALTFSDLRYGVRIPLCSYIPVTLYLFLMFSYHRAAYHTKGFPKTSLVENSFKMTRVTDRNQDQQKLCRRLLTSQLVYRYLTHVVCVCAKLLQQNCQGCIGQGQTTINSAVNICLSVIHTHPRPLCSDERTNVTPCFAGMHSTENK